MFTVVAGLVAASCMVYIAWWDKWLPRLQDWRRERSDARFLAAFWGDDD